jgi:MYXO-CTERM domain-containing protein
MKLKVVLAAVLMLGAFGAQAGFTKTDWNAVGDNLVTVDSSTGLEWLNLTATDNKSVSMVQEQMSTIYAGWRLPTNAEVVAMMSNMFNVPSSSLEFNTMTARSPSQLNSGANYFAKMMSNGASTTANHLGFYYDEDNVLRVTGVYLNDYGTYSFIVGLESADVYNYNSTLTGISNVGGVFLVKDSVSIEPEPVPSPLGLGLLGLLGVALASRRRQAKV